MIYYQLKGGTICYLIQYMYELMKQSIHGKEVHNGLQSEGLT
jgi:hypothetical protein